MICASSRAVARYRRGMGDNACWLDQTCLACGRFLDLDEVEGGRCPHCAAELPPPADAVEVDGP